MTSVRKTLLAVASALAWAATGQAAVWVSASGDDRNPGTEEKPLRSIDKARDLVRGLNRAMTDDITVFLSGIYHVSGPLEFGPADSGTNGYSVVYMAAPGAHPVVSGAVRVTNWTLDEPAGSVWSAPAPAGLLATRALFVNGIPARRTHIRLQQPDPGSDTTPILPVTSKNPALVEFVDAGPSPLWSDRVGIPPFFADNVFEGLGRPGEWYFDPTAKRLYYTPRSGEYLASADVEAAVASGLIEGTGTANHPVTGLVFKGIQFEYTTPDPSSHTGSSAAVRFRSAAYVQFLEDAFLHLGTAGLALGDSFQEGQVEGCFFGDIAGPALSVDLARQVHVTSSRFSYVSTDMRPSAVIEVKRSEDVGIDYCQIDHFPGQAIALERSGPVHDQMNRVAAPVLLRDSRMAPMAGAGIPRAFEGLLDDTLWAPAPPEPPTGVVVDPEDGYANVAWDPSCYDGGPEVTAYTVVASSGAKLSVSAAEFRRKGYMRFPGLENGRQLTFSVNAVNDLGPGAPSLQSAPVTPGRHRRAKPPRPPTAVTIARGNGRVWMTVVPSAVDGGSPLLAFTLTVPTAPHPLVIEGRDVLHATPSEPVQREVSAFAQASGTQASVTATNAAGEGKPASFRWP